MRSNDQWRVGRSYARLRGSEMSDHPKPEPKQTTPKGLEISGPKREDLLRNLKKAAPAPSATQPSEDLDAKR
jgi:hypothetical protein